ncbi:glycoside hydrolase family 13 protein, partial [Streptococcus danieliae]|nr:glycoside hydrolase family 13 protein [Streptococcus danieliae]
WWGFDNLPTVNKNNEDFLNFITKDDDGVVNFWQKLGIAGWRLDVADEFPDKFLDEIRRSAKSYDKESLIIGEVWEDASNKTAYNQRRRYFQGDQLDSVMNYP